MPAVPLLVCFYHEVQIGKHDVDHYCWASQRKHFLEIDLKCDLPVLNRCLPFFLRSHCSQSVRRCLRSLNGSILQGLENLTLPSFLHPSSRDVLRSLNLWIKGCVKSRAFLLRRRACFPSPSTRARAPASQRKFLSKNTCSSVQPLKIPCLCVLSEVLQQTCLTIVEMTL